MFLIIYLTISNLCLNLVREFGDKIGPISGKGMILVSMYPLKPDSPIRLSQLYAHGPPMQNTVFQVKNLKV